MHKSVLSFAPYGGKQVYRHKTSLATFWKENAGLSGQLVMFVTISIFSFYTGSLLLWTQAEEAPAALLLAQAALLSAKRQARRRAGLWYVSAAGRLEKCGIVSLSFCWICRTLMVISLEIFGYIFPTESAGIVQHTLAQRIIAFILGF